VNQFYLFIALVICEQ